MRKNKLYTLKTYLFLIIFTSVFLISCTNTGKNESNNSDNSNVANNSTNNSNTTNSDKEVDTPIVPKKDFALYFKDDTMYYSALNKTEPVKISVRKKELGNDGYNYYSNELIFGMNTKISKNQNRLFAMQESMDPFQTGTLKYYDIGDKSQLTNENIISDEVWNYKISNDGNIVAYQYGKDKASLNLYDATTKKTTVISDSIYKYHLSPDGKRLIFSPDGEEFFELEIGKEKQKIELEDNTFSGDSDNFIPYFYDDTFDSYYYINNELLFKKEFGKESIQIERNVKDIIKIYDNGQMYFVVLERENAPINFKSMLEDDLYESDKTMISKPVPPPPEVSDYPSNEEFEKANDEYYKAKEAEFEFSYKTVRDEYRNKLENNKELTTRKYAYYFYDGQKSTALGRWVSDYSGDGMHPLFYPVYSDKIPILIFHLGNSKPAKMSELGDFADLEALINSYMLHSSNICVAIGSEVKEVDGENIANIETSTLSISFDNNKAYINPIAESSDINGFENPTIERDLYEIDLSNGKVGKPTLYDTKLSLTDVLFNKNGDIFYFKCNLKDENYFDLYKNKELISENASILLPQDKSGQFLILKSPEFIENEFTLDYYKDDKVIEITKGAGYDNIITPRENVIYSKLIDKNGFDHDFYYKNLETNEDIKIVKDGILVDTTITWEEAIQW